ncbi:MAG TPA: RNA-binding cell elongation regulator Jag/EloR [Acidimicrobiales bacterium]|nr:RNA-binding cell elongation regulator Jag/EloR [Acidimicrobiales bacterium]
MEWVETTGRSVEEAKDAALDELGVDEQDAEFEVLEEPKVGLFGRLRNEARVRARVRPTAPRPKEDRRDRRRKKTGNGSNGAGQAAAAPSADGEAAAAPKPVPRPERAERRPRQEPKQQQQRSGSNRPRQEGAEVDEDVPLAEQGEVARQFLTGLMTELGATAEVAVRDVDEDTIELVVEGDDLGTLIGPKGTTLTALQELTRTVVQRRTGGRNGRLLVDVSGYRQKRREALEKFTHSVAASVLETGERKALEPMHPADRKVVHDTVNTIDGVRTISEGEEPRRRVVLLPEND